MLYVPYRTTTVMQITEYNLLSQSTNVYPFAPKDQYACTFLYMCICIYACMHLELYIVHIHIHTYMWMCFTEVVSRIGRLVDRGCWFVMRLNIQTRYSARIEKSKMRRRYLIGKLWTISHTKKMRRDTNRREQNCSQFYCKFFTMQTLSNTF